jgi:endo-1,3(4)-beta-glucanase
MKAWATKTQQATRWTLYELSTLPVGGFFPPRGADATLIEDFNVRDILRSEIEENFVLDGGSYYFTGKYAQKYATMCLLASETTVNTDPAVLDSCISKLQEAYDKFLRNGFEYPLVYDEVYRGISSSEGFERGDVNADFGNTVFSDHHFHYGVSYTMDPKTSLFAVPRSFPH